jgi:hypothetical protein
MPHAGLIPVSPPGGRLPTYRARPFPPVLRARQRTLGFQPWPCQPSGAIAAGSPPQIEDGPGQGSPVNRTGRGKQCRRQLDLVADLLTAAHDFFPPRHVPTLVSLIAVASTRSTSGRLETDAQ